jgi:hypothetical protein
MKIVEVSNPEPAMLDAFIIHRIREAREDRGVVQQIPLRIDVPPGPPPSEREGREAEDEGDAGVVEIDFTI